MDQQIVTIICGLILIAALASCYLRSKKPGADESDSKSISIKETMDEVSSYFGVDARSEDSLAQSFDLAPVKLASSLTNPAPKSTSPSEKNKKRRR